MGSSSGAGRAVALCAVMVLLSLVAGGAEADLTTDFYDQSCPQIYDIVKAGIQKAVYDERRMAASIVRLHFHDCFVNGCDGSVLLDDSPTIIGEKHSLANNNSIRGFEVIDCIKAALEDACPGTVSCADLLALAYRDAAVEVGFTENYPVFFGRRDSLSASRDEANRRLPSPFSNLAALKQNFGFWGLDEVDLITLSGAHTFGRVRCGLVRAFLGDTDGNAQFKHYLDKVCPANGDPLQVTNLDAKTPDVFDNAYYQLLIQGDTTLRSDQTLWSTPGPNQGVVSVFAQNQDSFFRQFAISSVKMGNLKPLTGDDGEIRVNCRVPNSAPAVAVA